MRSLVLVSTAAALGWAGCGDNVADPNAPTYFRDAKAIIDARCVTCHQPDNIGPFPLTNFEEVTEFAGSVRSAIDSRRMPPWQPSDECNEYVGNIDLTTTERETLLAWLDAGAPKGDPKDAPEASVPDEADFNADIVVTLPEAYTPTKEPDDYRCQLIPWPSTETRYVTGVRVTPQQRALVHHVILFTAKPDQVAQFQAYDDAEEGPGYTCYGGPRANDGGGALAGVGLPELQAALAILGLTLADLQSGNVTEEQFFALADELGIDAGRFSSIGNWVPGAGAQEFPAGTGIRVEPGSAIIAQFHYNTRSSEPVADQSSIEIRTVSVVEKPATMMPVLDVGWITNGRIAGEAMTIPAGEANVEHSTTVGFDSGFMVSARRTLGLAEDAPMVIHRAGHHMHQLGTTQRSEVRHSDGSSTCVLDIPDWDFHWQGAYELASSITINQGDEIWMGCSWDNTAANQPIIDGQVLPPANVSWGEGSSDEMCLGILYVTGE